MLVADFAAVLQNSLFNCKFVLVRFFMDFQVFCQLFYASHQLPITLYEDNNFVLSCGLEGNPPKTSSTSLLPVCYEVPGSGFYGRVQDKDNHFSLILGPTRNTSITYSQFLNLLLYLHFLLTGQKLDIGQTFGLKDTTVQQSIGHKHSEKTYEEREEGRVHGTYLFEQKLLNFIQNGDEEGLEKYFKEAENSIALKEGKLAENPIRQAKNIFIGWVTMVGKTAAIPGGLDIEQTYHLIDTYIQKCEKLQSEREILNLQYAMSMDFTKRVANHKLPQGVSKDVYACMQFISNHINEQIGVDNVVQFSGKSRAYLFKKFKAELKSGIGEYISRRRIQEAQALLRFTNKTLTEISSYLCFSSQSYFQNVFKAQSGMTPMEYRLKFSAVS